MHEIPAFRRVSARVARFRDWAGLSVSGAIAIASGAVALAITIVVLGGITEDVTRHNGLSSTDPTRLRWFIEHRPDALVSVARIMSGVGSPVALAAVAAVAALGLWFGGKRLVLALAPGIAFGLAGLGAAAVKLIVGRNRPPVPLHLIAESDPSFPSGHATESTAVFVTLALVVAVFVLRGPIVRSVTVLGAGLVSVAIGTSRLVLGVHWPSDVIAGWALGLAIALTVTIVASLVARIVPSRPISNRPAARVVRLLTTERDRRSLQAVWPGRMGCAGIP
jgi:membrane-associated phospholipid phosphatase